MSIGIVSQKISKKEAGKIVYEKLAIALAEYRIGIKEKKFANKLKKASKLFAADIAKTIGKKKEKPEKQSKKKNKSAATQELQAKEAS
jgi:hypothetical protein